LFAGVAERQVELALVVGSNLCGHLGPFDQFDEGHQVVGRSAEQHRCVAELMSRIWPYFETLERRSAPLRNVSGHPVDGGIGTMADVKHQSTLRGTKSRDGQLLAKFRECLLR
jgi:hypothetical protein